MSYISPFRVVHNGRSSQVIIDAWNTIKFVAYKPTFNYPAFHIQCDRSERAGITWLSFNQAKLDWTLTQWATPPKTTAPPQAHS